tara:strand:+ start:271 stop:921 length:651 start_codon:yes stop_codon:yes gene_type:complete
MIIAIDGPSASGKSTTAKGVAMILGYLHLDTGAMYRAVTLGFMNAGINLNHKVEVFRILKDIDITFNDLSQICLNGKSVSKQIRTTDISSSVSSVSAIPEVREKMVKIQREIAGKKNCVLEGRDIGTVVFPNARHKFFLVADTEIRAKRRLLEMRDMGEKRSLNDLICDIEMRDRLDRTRNHSPLVKADDAVSIDTSLLTINEQINKIVSIINKQK